MENFQLGIFNIGLEFCKAITKRKEFREISVKEVIATGLLNSIGIYSDLNSSQEQKLDLILKNLWIKNPDQNYSLLSAGEKKKYYYYEP